MRRLPINLPTEDLQNHIRLPDVIIVKMQIGLLFGYKGWL